MAFVVDIKPSARRQNAAVGESVNREGSERVFESRAAAEEWADGLAEAGEENVWVQAAHPRGASDVDGYLLSRQVRGRVERAAVDPGTQAELADAAERR